MFAIRLVQVAKTWPGYLDLDKSTTRVPTEWYPLSSSSGYLYLSGACFCSKPSADMVVQVYRNSLYRSDMHVGA